MSRLEGIGAHQIQQAYGEVMKQPFDIKGELLENEGNVVKVEISKDRVIEARLKEPLQGEVGQEVAIDKAQILSYRIYKQEEVTKKTETEATALLKKLGVEANPQTIEAVEALEEFEVAVTKENIEKLLIAKNYFDEIRQGLDYDTAIKLLDRELDVPHESLQKIAGTIKEVRSEKESFSLLKFLGFKKELATEEAEQVAKEIYGSRMGKDITDIIKALQRAGASLTKNNIEKIHDVFYKLDKLKNLGDKVFVEVYQQGQEPTIEQLYRQVLYIKEGSIDAMEGVGKQIAFHYEESLPRPIQVTEQEVRRMEEQIRGHLKEMELLETEENIKLSKELIKAGLPLTREHMEVLLEMKDALKHLTKVLNLQKASQLLQEGIPLEKMDIRKLSQLVEEAEVVLENPEDKKAFMDVEEETKNILQRLEKLKTVDERDLIKLLQRNVEFKLHKMERVLFGKQDTVEKAIELVDYGKIMKRELQLSVIERHSAEQVKPEKMVEKQVPQQEQLWVKGLNQVVKVAEIFSRVKDLSVQQVSYHLQKGMSLALGYIDKNHEKIMDGPIRAEEIVGSKEFMARVLEVQSQYRRVRMQLSSTMVMDSIAEGKELMEMELTQLESYVQEKQTPLFQGKKEMLQRSTEQVHEISQEYKKNEPILMKNQGDATLKEIANVGQFIENEKQVGKKTEAQGGYNIGEKSMEMELTQLESYVQEKQTPLIQGKKEMLQRLTEQVQEISQAHKKIIPFLMKNELDFTLKEIRNVSRFIKNQEQMGEKIGEILQRVGEIQSPELGDKLIQLEKTAKNISNKLKDGDGDLENAYEEWIACAVDLGKDMDFSQGQGQMQKQMEDFMESLELQKKLQRKESLMQLPVEIAGRFENLQIFMQNGKSFTGRGKDGLRTMLNLHTPGLGQVQMEMKIQGNSVALSMVVPDKKGQQKAEAHTAQLKGMLEEIGYQLGSISIKTLEENQGVSRERRTSRIFNIEI